jgi:hypothetical protein
MIQSKLNLVGKYNGFNIVVKLKLYIVVKLKLYLVAKFILYPMAKYNGST